MDNMQAKDVLPLAICGLSFPASYAEVSEESNSKAARRRWRSKAHNLGLLPENTWQKKKRD